MAHHKSNDSRRHIPHCSKCGAPARVIVLTKARVRCDLEDDGGVGKVLSASRTNDTMVGYECGGGHVWENAKR